LGAVGVLVVERGLSVGEQRDEQDLTHAEKTAGGVDGHRSMHLARDPPGQPEGVGEGEGGDGEGPGVGLEEVVEPISPNRMFE